MKITLVLATLTIVVCALWLRSTGEGPTTPPEWIGAPATQATAKLPERSVELVTPEPEVEQVSDTRNAETDETSRKSRLKELSREELEERIAELEALAEKGDELRSLVEAQSNALGVKYPSWNAGQIIGRPDADASRDDPKAWAPSQPDAGAEWVTLGFAKPQRADLLRIYEVNSAGAVTRVTATSDKGRTYVLWSGIDPTVNFGVFAVHFKTTRYRIASIRIDLDTSLKPSWNEIDAVELVGPDERQWVATAEASSNYGQGRTTFTNAIQSDDGF